MGKKSRVAAARAAAGEQQQAEASSSVPPALRAGSRLLLVSSYIAAAVAVVVFGWSVSLAMWQNLELPWTSMRLAPSFALAQGLSLFSTPEQGPWVLVGYGPLYPVAYLPAVFASHPTTAVAVATLIAHLLVLGPIALICSLAAGGRWLLGGLSFVLLALVTHCAPSLMYITAGVHADAPAFGLVLLGCYACLRGAPVQHWRWFAAAGVLAGLGAACKINLLPVLAPLALWVWWTAGWRHALVVIGGGAAALMVVYAWTMWRDGAAAVLLNLRLPGRMPWFAFAEFSSLSITGATYETSDKVRTFFTLLRTYLLDYGSIALAVLVFTRWQRPGAAAGGERLVMFFLLMAVLLLPVSIASIGKYGGDVNSRALVSLPLALAAVFALLEALRRGSLAAGLGMVAAVAGATLMVGLQAKDLSTRRAAGTQPTLVEAFSVLSADPGRWYFPHDPLAHLLVEGRFRPSVDVIYSYALAGSPVEEAAFRAALPENLAYVAMPPSVASWGASEVRRLLPEFDAAAADLQFARHQVLSK